MNPHAFFMPCGAHSLNLVVNDAALCKQIRTDGVFEKILVDCREVSEYCDSDSSFHEENLLHPREKENNLIMNQSVLDLKTAFRNNFLFFVLDQRSKYSFPF